MDEGYGKSDAPPAYDASAGSYSHTQTTTSTSTSNEGIHLNRGYLRTIPAILKYIEAFCSLICLICASIYVQNGAAGWGGFVAGTALFTVILWFFFYLFNVVSKMPAWIALFELVYYVLLTICYLIAAILAAAVAGVNGSKGAGLGVFSFFGFIATGVFAVDLFFQFKKWRSGGHTTTQTHTTTTTTSSEVRY